MTQTKRPSESGFELVSTTGKFATNVRITEVSIDDPDIQRKPSMACSSPTNKNIDATLEKLLQNESLKLSMSDGPGSSSSDH